MAGALFERLFGVSKPVIAMVHFPPLPGTPQFDAAGGVEHILDTVRRDLEALQGAGADAVMFGNEGDRPYQLRVDVGCTATMASVIGRVKEQLRIPFGVDCGTLRPENPGADVRLSGRTVGVPGRNVP